MSFPNGFLWGASTSAYQCEGAALEDGKKASQQDVINAVSSQLRHIADCSVATDHYHHFREDVAYMKQIGLKSYRFSIAWSRIFPDGTGEPNWKGVRFYHELIDELKESGIEPIVTMYHYDLPMALVEKYGGWMDRRVVDDFEAYARFIVNEYKDKVRYWTTINEQNCIVYWLESKCLIPEERKTDFQLRYQINHYMNLAHAKACKIVHELVPDGKVGSAIGYAPIYPQTSKPDDAIAALNAHELKNSFYLDVYFKGIYNPIAFRYLQKLGYAPVIEDGDMQIIQEGKSDFLAINYYYSECAHACTDDETGKIFCYPGVNYGGVKGGMDGYENMPGFYKMCKNTNLETSDWDWAIDGSGLRYALRDIYSRYNVPLMITENGLGAYDVLTEDGKVHDPYRIAYMQEHIRAIGDAIDDGVEVISYNCWSAIDILSTSNGMKKRYGLVYVDRTDDDVKQCKRYRKDSSYWYEQVIASNGKNLESALGV